MFMSVAVSWVQVPPEATHVSLKTLLWDLCCSALHFSNVMSEVFGWAGENPLGDHKSTFLNENSVSILMVSNAY